MRHNKLRVYEAAGRLQASHYWEESFVAGFTTPGPSDSGGLKSRKLAADDAGSQAPGGGGGGGGC